MKYVVEYECPYQVVKHDRWNANNELALYQFLQMHPKYLTVYKEIDMVEFNKLGREVKLDKWLHDRGYHSSGLALEILKVLEEK